MLGIEYSITCHGETVGELTANLDAAIDHHLADCAANGWAPKMPCSGAPMRRIPPEVYDNVVIAAEAQGKSLNQWAVEVLPNAS